MLATLKSRRGTTLAEIMVALALVSVMIVMVVSFALLITDRTRNNTVNDTVKQDRILVESVVEGWVSAQTGAELSVSDETVLTAKVGETETYTVKFEYGTLTGELPDDESITVSTEYVKSVSFKLMKNDDESDYLLFCTVTSQTEDSDEDQKYTFCVNPRVGEAGGTTDEAAETTA